MVKSLPSRERAACYTSAAWLMSVCLSEGRVNGTCTDWPRPHMATACSQSSLSLGATCINHPNLCRPCLIGHCFNLEHPPTHTPSLLSSPQPPINSFFLSLHLLTPLHPPSAPSIMLPSPPILLFQMSCDRTSSPLSFFTFSLSLSHTLFFQLSFFFLCVLFPFVCECVCVWVFHLHWLLSVIWI